jgi:hypothetical protein
MIDKIFWDMDETLIHSSSGNKPDGNYVEIKVGNDVYYTSIHPHAKDLINYSRQLVGCDKVFILTTSTSGYALKVNEEAEFGFKPDKIISQKDLEEYRTRLQYNPHLVEDNCMACPFNVLIDNLPPRYNVNKISFIGILNTFGDNYLQVEDYYGGDDEVSINRFKDRVIKFLNCRLTNE